MDSGGSSWVKGALISSVITLLLILHCSDVFLETMVVTSHGKKSKVSATQRTLGRTEITEFRTCTPSSIPEPERNKDIGSQGRKCVCESANEGNEPGYPGDILQTRQGQNVVFE